MSWLLAGAVVSAVAGAGSTASANQADQDAAAIDEMGERIKFAQTKQRAAVDIENMITDLGSLESAQTAIASGMGKRDSGGSQTAIKEHQRGLLTRDIEDIDKTLALDSKLMELGISSTYTAADSRADSRWSSWGTSVVGSFTKVLAP